MKLKVKTKIYIVNVTNTTLFQNTNFLQQVVYVDVASQRAFQAPVA